LILASFLIAPVAAHTSNPGHLWTAHIRPKTDSRYDQSKVVTSNDASTTTNGNFVNLPGATTSITIPGGGESWRILARFDAESLCEGPDGSWCSLQLLIGSAPGNPDDGSDYAFDAPGATPGDDWEGHALSRSRIRDPGTYTVTVQWRVVSGATSFQLDDWHLSVETLRVA
jgi:hypothetical protein